jgi:chloramphenicol O-acetyltransferase type A
MEIVRRQIEIENWNRKEHFAFFRDFYEPCYGITSRVDCTEAYRYSKDLGFSFFISCLYWTLKAAQEVEAFALRIEEEKLFHYDRVDAGSAIDRPDGTFGFGYFVYNSDMQLFVQNAVVEVDRVRESSGLNRPEAQNIIRYSSLPWIDFTSITHAQKSPTADSCPRITFGKMSEENGRRSIPIAIHVNHALVDGRDVGKFFELFQQILSKP